MNIIEAAVKASGKSVRDIFMEAYQNDKSADFGNWLWAHDLFKRSGIITKTAEAFATGLVEGSQLPLDFPDGGREHFG